MVFITHLKFFDLEVVDLSARIAKLFCEETHLLTASDDTVSNVEVYAQLLPTLRECQGGARSMQRKYFPPRCL